MAAIEDINRLDEVRVVAGEVGVREELGVGQIREIEKFRAGGRVGDRGVGEVCAAETTVILGSNVGVAPVYCCCQP